jgi:NTE family protein
VPGPLRRGRTALVLAGGAARGAYEIGVVQHVLEEVSKDIGSDIHFDILSGTSVGARVVRLIDVWTSLDLVDLVRPDVRGILEIGGRLVRRRPTNEPIPESEGGLIDPSGLERLVERSIPFDRIELNLHGGHLAALTVSTTHVKTGRTIVHVQCREGEAPIWRNDSTTVARRGKITARHALASAAIPILFRSVALDGAYHADGGLRQNVPLSPARRLGASKLLVVNPRFISTAPLPDHAKEERPGLFFLLGKTLNALLLDRVDSDLARLETINRILDAGVRVAGPGFVTDLNREMGFPEGQGLSPLRAHLIRASADIGKMAAAFVQSPSFSRVGGMTGRLMRGLADRDSKHEADLLSYLLFDGEFARQLIELGRSDARKRHDELCRFFAESADP